MKKIYTLDEIDVKNQRVLLRLDLNMPMHEGQILDFERMDKIIPTLQELVEKQAKVIICAHLGRPKGRDPSLSMAKVADALSAKLDQPIQFMPNLEDGEKTVKSLMPGQIAFLENLRFYDEEEKNDPGFAKQLANLADIYVNDAFSVSHRAHASVEAIAHILPSFAGRHMHKEITALSHAFDHPKQPIIAIVGGSKISTKLNILKSLVQKVMYLVPAGGIANTFALAHDQQVGRSLCEPEMVDMVLEIEEIARQSGCAIIPPSDVVVTESLTPGSKHRTCSAHEVHYKEMIVDFGPQTVMDIFKISQLCRTFLWNGPLGVFEVPPYDEGSVDLAKKIANLSEQRGLFSFAGGGETNAVIYQAGVHEKFTYMSTAGGAFLEWIEGKSLPGIQALMQSHTNLKNRMVK